jgi:hypothetical protein
MEPWSPKDPQVLQFDFNACPPRTFCEVLNLDREVAGYLQEYRREMLHIFKLEQLLKIKGVTQERLKEWVEAKPSSEFNRDFQSSIGLTKDEAEPLPKVLDALCKTTEASSGALVALTDGSVLLEASGSSQKFEKLAKTVKDFLPPIQDNLYQMKLNTAEAHVLTLENGKLMFFSAGGVIVVSTFPKDKGDTKAIKLWNTFAQEVRRRVPPKLSVENHAKVTETDIAFDCPQCSLRIVVDKSAAGAIFPCPRCKANLTTPDQTTSFSSFKEA